MRSSSPAIDYRLLYCDKSTFVGPLVNLGADLI